jgi:hypothetical protein
MRFTEIANAEDQLALWKLVSDKMWAAFGQQPHQQAYPAPTQPVVNATTQAPAKSISAGSAKPQGRRKDIPVKARKPKKPPYAPLPKALPKPKPQQVNQTQNKNPQIKQQPAQLIHQPLLKKSPVRASVPPQPLEVKSDQVKPDTPMTNSYSERDKDELVFHSRSENPFKTVSQTQSGLTTQKPSL